MTYYVMNRKEVMGAKIYVGNALEILPKLEAGSVHCDISSPPYLTFPQ